MKISIRLCVLLFVNASFLPGLTFAEPNAEDAADDWVEAQEKLQAKKLIDDLKDKLKDLEEKTKLGDNFMPDLETSINGYLKGKLKEAMVGKPPSLAMAEIIDAIQEHLLIPNGTPCIRAAREEARRTVSGVHRGVQGGGQAWVDLMDSLFSAPGTINDWFSDAFKKAVGELLDELRKRIRAEFANSVVEAYETSFGTWVPGACESQLRVIWYKSKGTFSFGIFGECFCKSMPSGPGSTIQLAKWSVQGEGVAKWKGAVFEKNHKDDGTRKNRRLKGTPHVTERREKGLFVKPRTAAVCCKNETESKSALDPWKIKVAYLMPGFWGGGDEETAYAFVAPTDARTVLPEAAIAGGKIFGMVIDDAGDPVVNSAVQVTTALTGEVIDTRTNSEGEFVVDVPSEGDSLHFSVIGSALEAATIAVLQSIGDTGRRTPPDYVEAGSQVTMRGNYQAVEFEPMSAPLQPEISTGRVPLAIATTADGQDAFTTYQVPQYLPAGQMETRLFNVDGSVERYDTAVFNITSASIDDESLRSGQRAKFVYGLDFGFQPSEQVYYDIALSGPIESSQAGNPQPLEIDGDGKARIEGMIQAIPGKTGNFIISILIGTSPKSFSGQVPREETGAAEGFPIAGEEASAGGGIPISLAPGLDTEETAIPCKIPTKPFCDIDVSYPPNQTKVSCVLKWKKLSKTDKKHSGECGLDHGRINKKCKAYLASAGTRNERFSCKFDRRAAKKAITFTCLPEGTTTPIAIDPSLDHSVTANWP